MEEEIAQSHELAAVYHKAVQDKSDNEKAQANAHAKGLQIRKDLDAMVASEKAEQNRLKLEMNDAHSGLKAATVAYLTIGAWQPADKPVDMTFPGENAKTKKVLADMFGCADWNEECQGKVAHNDGPSSFLETFSETQLPMAKLASETIKTMLLQDGASRGLAMPQDEHLADGAQRSRDYTSLIGMIATVCEQMAKTYNSGKAAYDVSMTATSTGCDSETVDSAYGFGLIFTTDEAEFPKGKSYCLGMLALTQTNNALHQAKENAEDADAKAGATKKNLLQVQMSLDANQEALKKMNKNCEHEAAVFTHDAQTAEDEVNGLDMVAAVISQGASDVAAVTAVQTGEKGFVQTSEEFDFLQLSMSKTHKFNSIETKPDETTKSKMRQAIKFLQIRNQENQHPALTMVMMELSNTRKRDPFKHVIQMINRLIQTLETEATEDATHHGFCQSQMAEANGARKDAQNQIKKLTADMKKAGADMDVFMAQHAAAMGDLYEARNAFKTMVHQRETSRAENLDALEQSKIAVQTMKKAMKLMKKMLIHTKNKHVFLQAKPYEGAQQGGSNVMNMLEVLLDRFQKAYDSMQQQEKQSQSDFNDMKTQLSSRIASQTQTATDMSRSTVTRFGEFVHLKEDLRDQNGLLKSAFNALEALKPACVETHADKIQKLQSTIDSLQGALDIIAAH